MRDEKFVETLCAICETAEFDREIYRANLDDSSSSYDVFSARRTPDRRHYRMVQCQNCGLVRSNPIFDDLSIAGLYAGSHFTYDEEATFAAQTYIRYLKNALHHLGHAKARLLEIGCGNGFFLKEAKAIGVDEVYGVEPSHEAVEKSGDLEEQIYVGMFESNIYPANYFDLICAFQVFDHIAKPNPFLANVRHYLKQGGLALFINHDIGSLAAFLLGERCPMIDVEHTYLYNRMTLRKIFEKNNMEVLDVFSVSNSYPLNYWMKLAPFPSPVKNFLMDKLEDSDLGRLPCRLSVGNIGIIARKN